MRLVSVSEELSNKVVFTLLFVLALCWVADALSSWGWTPVALLVAASLSAAWLLLDVLISERNGNGKRFSALLGVLILIQIADRLAFLPGWVSAILFGVFVVLAIWHLVSGFGGRRGAGSA
jgi:phosphoglycerol transferase MdoB-like AlkP superfamily enzyme